jgi:hypothetical protein
VLSEGACWRPPLTTAGYHGSISRAVFLDAQPITWGRCRQISGRGSQMDAQRAMLGADQRRDTRVCGTDRLGDSAVRLGTGWSRFRGWWFLRPRHYT